MEQQEQHDWWSKLVAFLVDFVELCRAVERKEGGLPYWGQE
jgi:hypothetical protein